MRGRRASGWAVRIAAVAAGLGLLGAAGCHRVISGPAADEETSVRPDEVHNFDTLYKNNCAGCHGADGKNGPAIPMNNPMYMATVSDDQLRQVTANGQTGTLMPAFAQSAGGLLTDAQVNVLVAGMRQRWGGAQAVAGTNPPPYAAHTPGDTSHGAQVYAAACASCHGAMPAAAAGQDTGGATLAPGKHQAVGKAGSIVDPTFLALLSDQSLRTIVIAGRPDLGQPDWRGDIPGHPLSDGEITDVVAWLSSLRQPAPGQTHPDPAKANPGASELQRRVQ